MPRRAGPPHLVLDKQRGTWIIRDGAERVRTGCRSKGEAAQRLAEYIAGTYSPKPSPSPLISDVLSAYLDHRPQERLTISNLVPYWAERRVFEINAATCREYAKQRPPVAARRDLETLRAATNHWDRHVHNIERKPTVVLPERPASRTRSLARGDVARLVWAARRTPHLARFILLGFYTGSRAGALLDLRWDWVDTGRGILHRREPGTADSKTKRRPPIKLGRRILSHLRKWERRDRGISSCVIHYNGRKVTKLRRSWRTACEKSGVQASPHDLRRTRATIWMSAGEDPYVIAQALGMSIETLLGTYTIYHPDWQSKIANVHRTPKDRGG
jgi:integrase